MNEKKLRLRFTYENDLTLLREFINNNPITNEDGWQQIQNNVFILTQKQFTIRTLKQHLMLLLEIFLKKAKVEEVRSGIEVPCNEKDNLLEEVSSMCKEANYSIKPTRKKTGLTKDQQLCLVGKNIRMKYAENYFLDEESREGAVENTEDNLQAYILEEHDYTTPDDVANEVVQELSQIESASVYDNYSQPGTSQLSSEGPSHVNMNKDDKNTPSKQSKYAENTESTPKNSDGAVARNVLVPTRKRRQREPVRKNALSYLNNKHQTDLEMKKKEIALENRRLDIEEKKIKLDERRIGLQEKQCELEHKERVEKLNLEKRRVEIELHEKQITQQLLQSQQTIINKFLKEYIE